MWIAVRSMIALGSLAASTLHAQTTPQTPPTGGGGGEAIVVTGTPEEEYARLERSIRTGFSTGVHRPDLTARAFERSERAANCAAPARMISPQLLSGVVDGVFNSAKHDRLQDQLFVQTAACGIGSWALHRLNTVPPGAGSSTTEAGVILRGAVIIAVLERYAPRLQLTSAMLRDSAVVRRFVAREEPRAKLRIPDDLRYFKVTTCLVQQQPETAIAVVYGDAGSGDVRMQIARMIDRERQCVGGAKQVGFDPIHFRLYLADSLYRWAVAAQGVDTLIPVSARN